MAKPRTLYDKIWDEHLVHEAPDGTCLLYIDRHLVHEVTSPQAFEGLRMTGRKVRAPEKTLAVVDHNVPTSDRSIGIDDPESALQVATLAENAKEFGIEYYHERDRRQGIVHVVGPEQGFTLPGTTIVCGDSHTSTHGAFGALAHGIGTSEVEHVLATQTLIQKKARNMRVRVDGALKDGVTAKDIILAIIGEIGTAGGTGHVIEYAGEAIEALSMEGRMTICNMSIEGGARAGLIAPDDKTFEYIKGRPRAPKAGAYETALRHWQSLYSDKDAAFDSEIVLHAEKLPPLVTWGTSPEQVVSISGRVPRPEEIADEMKRTAAIRSLDYMGLQGGEKITDLTLDRVFIGSCTNGRIEDLREVARIVDGKRVHANVSAMIVPGSGLVKEQAEAEGLDKIFKDAGFDWREPGCSMCLGMNPDQLKPTRALRLDLEPQFRGPPGQARPHPSRLAGDGGGGGACRPLRRHPRRALSFDEVARAAAVWQSGGGLRHLRGARQGRKPQAPGRAHRAEIPLARARRRHRRRPYRACLRASRRQGHRHRHHRGNASRGAEARGEQGPHQCQDAARQGRGPSLPRRELRSRRVPPRRASFRRHEGLRRRGLSRADAWRHDRHRRHHRAGCFDRARAARQRICENSLPSSRPSRNCRTQATGVALASSNGSRCWPARDSISRTGSISTRRWSSVLGSSACARTRTPRRG